MPWQDARQAARYGSCIFQVVYTLMFTGLRCNQILDQPKHKQDKKPTKRKTRIKWWTRMEKEVKQATILLSFVNHLKVGLSDWNWLLRGGSKGRMCFHVRLFPAWNLFFFLMHYKLLNICSFEFWLKKKKNNLGFPGEESACQCRRHRFSSWFKKIPHVSEQLSLCHNHWARSLEPGNHSYWSLRT